MSGENPLVARALDEIRPRLRGHAGDMTATMDDDGVVTVRFVGACEACPAMAVTFAGLVRTTLRMVPGVRSVEAPQLYASAAALDRIEARLQGQELPIHPV